MLVNEDALVLVGQERAKEAVGLGDEDVHCLVGQKRHPRYCWPEPPPFALLAKEAVGFTDEDTLGFVG